MIKKSLAVLSVAAAFFAQAQDVSTIKNSIELYSSKNMPGSARHDAMAGANGALGGEATSLLSNPAGLGVAIAGSLTGTLSVGNYKNTSSMGPSSVSYDNNLSGISNLGAVVAFGVENPESPVKFVNVGFNYSNRSVDDYIETAGNNITIQKNLVDVNNNPFVGNLNLQRHAYDRTGSISEVAVGVGANIQNAFYIGGGLKMKGLQLEQYDTARFHLDLDNTVSDYAKQYTPYLEEASGVALNIGVIGKVGKMLRLGAALETPTWWTVQRSYTDYYQNTSGTISSDVFNEDRKFRSPLSATLSAALVPTKNFSVNVDYSVGITKPHFTEYGPAETELNDFYSNYYNNSHEVKLGAEYRILGFRLRGGFAHATNPLDGIAVSSYNNGQVSSVGYEDLMQGKRNTFGLGLGYDWKKFFVDLSFQNQTSTYSSPFLYGETMAANNYTSGYYSSDFDITASNYAVSEVKNVRNNFLVGIGFKF